MKSKQQVFKRLKKLYLRYLKRYVNATQKRTYLNCKHCENHVSRPLCYNREPPAEFELFPTHVSSLVVVNTDPDPGPIPLCMYGANDPKEWGGNTCNDEIAKSCKLFSPRLSIEEAKNQFDELIKDDKYVLRNHNDIAVLQWVLDDRIVKHLSWWDRLWIWARSFFFKPDPLVPQLPPPEIPENFWDDSAPNS